MKQIITAAQAKEIDRYSIEELGMPGIVLMERAALKFTQHVIERLGSFSGKVLAVCGSGNNGGDGMAAIRILADKGYNCAVYLAGSVEKMTESAEIQWKLLKMLSIPIVSEFKPEPGTVIIDALFGVGLSRKVTGHYAELIQKMNQFRCFAVDLPSGLNADKGQGMTIDKENCETAVKAEMTVTFGLVKPGLILGNGRQYAGEVFSEEIGFPKKAIEQICHCNIEDFYWKADQYQKGSSDDIMQSEKENWQIKKKRTDNKIQLGWYLEDSDISLLLPERKEDSNKGSYGRVLIFAGSQTMIGAAYYAGKAAYRTGAGLVEIVTCWQNIPTLASMLPGAVYTPVEDLFFQTEKGAKNVWTADREVLEQKIDAAAAIVLGPGLSMSGLTECVTGVVLALCSQKKKPLILDADGLNIFARHTQWQELLTQNMILTPHIKEMSRLCKIEVSEIKKDMIAIAGEFSQKNHGVTLVLKDSRSVITNGNNYFINMSGNNGMSVGGSGDVLSGILGGLVAQAVKSEEYKMNTIEERKTQFSLIMAALAAYLHGKAGEAAKKESNAYSMMADDILHGLKLVL